MPELDQLFANAGRAVSSTSVIWEAVVVDDTNPDGAMVTIPVYSSSLRWGPCMPQELVPDKGTRVAVTIADSGELWIVGAPQAGGGGDGTVGPPGPTGPAGPAGATGPAGAQGSAGPQGVPGPPGADGTDGSDGAQGPAGPAGAPGATGPAGPGGPTVPPPPPSPA